MLPNLRIDSSLRALLSQLILIAVILVTGCDKNYFADYVSTPNDESLLYSARNEIRNGSYASAISDCSGISSSALGQERFATICASAFAGRCGFTMSFMTTNLPWSAPWGTFMITTLGATVVGAINDCDTAEAILRGIGAPAVRSADANFFMLTLSLYKLGVISKALGDTDNNKILDGPFDACTISNLPATNYQLMTAEAVWDLLKSAGQLTSDPVVGVAATAIVNQCTILHGVTDLAGHLEDICAATDPTALTADQILGGLSTLKEGTAFGVNQGNCNASALTCNCR